MEPDLVVNLEVKMVYESVAMSVENWVHKKAVKKVDEKAAKMVDEKAESLVDEKAES